MSKQDKGPRGTPVPCKAKGCGGKAYLKRVSAGLSVGKCEKCGRTVALRR